MTVRLQWLLAGVASIALLQGCSGGGSSSGSSEQDPDPVAVDFPIAYVSRALNFEEEDGSLMPDNLLEPAEFRPGAKLILKDRASASAAEQEITAGLFEGDYDVRDLSVSPDGQQLVFAMRAPEIPDADEDEQPTWNIWLYDRGANELSRVISSDLIAEEGEDVAPSFLADGRIVFSSTRQRRSRALLLDDNKPQFPTLTEDLNSEAFVLHSMEPDGSDIRQISFNQSHDLHPTLLADGRLVFNRWDNMGGVDNVSLYAVRPDGTDLSLLYGYHSQQTGTGGSEAIFSAPRELPDGRLLVILRSAEGIGFGGDLVAVDAANYVEAYSEPDMSGVLQGQASLSVLEVLTDGSLSPHGLFAAAWPFRDGTSRLLVSWSECRVLETDTAGETLTQPCTDERLADPEVVAADPLYGLWIYDYESGTQLPIVLAEEGVMISEGAIMEPSALPEFLPEKIPVTDLDRTLVDEGSGVLDIRSVYDFDGVDIAGIDVLADPAQTTADLRPARYLRVVKGVAIPDDDVRDFDRAAFGRNRAEGMREILGYTPIQPDGSVRVILPADMPLAISVVDADGQRITGRHRSWLQLRPGEIRTCNGCHTGGSEVPHGRADKEPASAWAGAPTSAAPFANTEPALLAEMGETMAQVLARIAGEASLQRDIEFADLWTDPLVRPKDVASSVPYADLETLLPFPPSCLDDWSRLCRTVIHYPIHIAALWERGRPVLDGMGLEVANNRCQDCHTNRDAAGMTQVPAGQLDLGSGQSGINGAWMVSYPELVLNTAQQQLVDGALQEVQVQDTDDQGNPLFETDENGELILDSNGDPIPVMVTVEVPRLVGGAAVASRFFDIFAAGGAHEGYLDPVELRLISEWIDLGAQYYNDPFEAPVD